MKITFVGDFMVKDSKLLYFDNKLRSLLNESDVNCVNFEAPVYVNGLKPIEKSGPNLYQNAINPFFLEKAGFNLISLSNNHIMDYGKEGLICTSDSFKKSVVLGVGDYFSANNVKFYVHNNLKIGFISCCQYEFGMVDPTNRDQVGVAWISDPIIDEVITKAKKECDFLFVLPHAGLENCPYPLPEYINLYHHFIKMGADGIFASHPHIPQPIEIFDGKPIIYSLGNFCFDTIHDSNLEFWNRGLIVSIQINKYSPTISLKTNFCFYDEKEKCVRIDNDNKNFADFINTINGTFNNKDNYLKEINNFCNKLETQYESFFNASGYFKYDLKTFIKTCVKDIIKRTDYKRMRKDSLMNLIRCETHRWVISRIYENKKRN